MLDTLIKNVTAVTMDDEGHLYSDAYIAIKDGKISYIGTEAPQEQAEKIIDGRGMIAMPGLVNTHSHAAMSLMRGYADDYVLQEWLNDHVFPIEGKLVGDDVYWAMLWAQAEMLATGTIAYTDMYMHLPKMAQAAVDGGLYANISNGAMCFNPAGYCFDTDGVTGQNREVLERFHQADNGRVKLDVSIHAEYTSFPGLWQDFSAYAAENGLNMHIHLSETRAEHENCIAKYGKTPAAILAENGVFNTRATAAHCVWVSDADMDLLREKQVTVAHNPVSNLKLASGIAPVARMLEKGVNVALGTDGVCSNNNHDLFEEIKLAALLQKGVSGDPRLVPAQQALKMATRAGAFAQGREQEIGQLKEGFDASLILVDTGKPGLYPVHNPVSTLAYSARGGDVYLTMIRGKVLYENGIYTALDMEHIRSKMEPILNRLFHA